MSKGDEKQPAPIKSERFKDARWGAGEQPGEGPKPLKGPVGRGRRTSKLVIEIAANEDDIKKHQNPNVPYTSDEIAADAISCAKAGATLYHFHNRDPQTGRNKFDSPELYFETVQKIRKESDIVFCPSYGLNPTLPWRPQLEYLREYCSDPALKPEIMGLVPVHEGGISTHYNPAAKQWHNPKNNTIAFLELLRDLEIKPIFDLLEVGHLREVLAYLDYGLIEEPLTIKLFLSDVGCYGIPPTPQGIMMWDALLDPRYDWQVLFSIYGPAGSPSRDFGHALAVAAGHHLRLGIGDFDRAGFLCIRDIEGEERKVSNTDIVKQAVGWGKEVGREIATIDEAREIFGIRRGF